MIVKTDACFGTRLPGIEYGQRPGAYALIFNAEGHLAVIRSQNCFWLPGGGMDTAETPEQCLHRELKEELGWTVHIHSYLGKAGQYSYIHDLKAYLYKLGFFFIAEKTGELAGATEADHELVWLSPGEAMNSLLHESQIWAVRQAVGAPRLRPVEELRGAFQYHFRVTSQYLSPARDIIVYLPPGYHRNRAQRYPVLYMQDGNNLFDERTAFLGRAWKLDATIEHLLHLEQIRPMIVVGIYNTVDRMDEYTWYPTLLGGQVHGGWGRQYARFLVEELKPMIDRTYRTLRDRLHTTLMGSSLGALISFYAAWAYPRIFGQIGMMSPTVYWARHQILEDVRAHPPYFRIWVDIGTKEGTDPETEETVESTTAFVNHLLLRGYGQAEDLGYYIDPDAGHDEHAWSRRAERPLCFFYPKG